MHADIAVIVLRDKELAVSREQFDFQHFEG